MDKFILESESDFLKVFKNNEVTVPDTITDKGIDIPGGLLDQKIFGPVKNYTCRCGNLSGIIYDGLVCKKCGVKVTNKSSRSEEFGYFHLNTVLPHPFYKFIIFSKILRIKKVDNSYDYLFNPTPIYFTGNIKGPLKVKIDDKEIIGKITRNSGDHLLGYGIEFLDKIFKILIPGFNVDSYFDDKPNLYRSLINNPTISILRLLPANYREIYKVNGINVIDTLNLAYKSIMSSSKRIEFYKESPEYYLNSKFWYEVLRMSDEIESLYLGNGLKFKNIPIKNYSKILNRKGGLIRNQLLGKRSEFSSRSVNSSVEPKNIDISEDEIIVPFMIAKNILRVHLLSELFGNHGISYEKAMDHIDQNSELVQSLLREMDGKYYVYTSRAPALYKYSFMSFKMRINFDIDDKTIKIHPLQNSMFNLDYDGDTMSLFLPITVQSQEEARINSTPSNNLFYDKDGSPIYEFSIEFIYGLYYATNPELGDLIEDGSDSYLCDYASDDNKITNGSYRVKELFDTYGFSDYYELGQVLDKKSIKSIVKNLMKDNLSSIKSVLKLMNDLMILSSEGFTESGLSIKFNDFIKIDKSNLVKSEKVIEYINEESKLLNEIASYSPKDNSFISMLKSGAKGDFTQIKQVMLGKGVLVDKDGNYLPIIKNSLSEGLDFDEFITTISAGRRGLVSKSLSTALTGYLYYKLVKSMRDLVITEDDCGSTEGLMIDLESAEGRVLSQDYFNYKAGDVVDKALINDLSSRFDSKITIPVRSPIHCKCKNGICRKCYGHNISKAKMIEVGDRVGVITGSSMSEVMSQSMLRQFHTAGSTNINKKKVFSNSNIEKLDIEEIFDYTKIKINGLEYLIPTNRLDITKSENIQIEDLVFSYNTDNNDISNQFKNLESILELRTPKDRVVIAPIDGTLSLESIENTVVMVKNKNLKIDTPKRVRNIKVKIQNDTGSVVLNVPYNKLFLVPFGSKVSRGDLLTNGNIDYKSDKVYFSKDTLIKYLIKDLNQIYESQGSKLNSIHFEIIISHLLSSINSDDVKLTNIIDQGLDRSFIQHMSLGWSKKAHPHLFDKLNTIGNTNADKIALGQYS